MTQEMAAQLLDETEIFPHKRALPTGHSGTSPPSKSPVAAAWHPRQAARHFFPYGDCVEHESRGSGWTEPGGLYRHVNNCHLAAGHMPTEQFLRHYNKDVRSTCKLLKKEGNRVRPA